ncbi:MAG TPA: hypothetical protein VGQ83_42725 [Polyangia bacterium]
MSRLLPCIAALTGALVLGCAGRAAPPVSATPASAAAAIVPDVDGFVAELRAAGDRGPAALTAALRRVDPLYGTGAAAQVYDGQTRAWRPAPLAGIDVFRGQMDGDAAPEVVVQVRHHGDGFGEGGQERAEGYWIGVFDRRAGGWALVGALRTTVNHCNFDGAKLGLLVGFTSPTPGPNAALWVRTQDASSCGTLVSFGFTKIEYRVTPAGLAQQAVPAPKGMDHNRTAPAPAAPPAPAACLSPAARDAPLAAFTRRGDRLRLCVETDNRKEPECLAFDPGKGTYHPAEVLIAVGEVRPPEPPYSVIIEGRQAKVCPAGRPTACQVVTLAEAPRPRPASGDAGAVTGAVSPDGARLFLYRYAPKGARADHVAEHRLFGELYEVRTGKKLWSRALPVGTARTPGMFADPSNIWSAGWHGRHLLLSSRVCCGPAGAEAFLDQRTGRLLPIGDPSLFVQLDEDRFLVGVEERASTGPGRILLKIVNAATRKEATFVLPGRPRDEPETRVLAPVRLADGTFAIAHANPPGVVFFDPKAERLGGAHPAPLCPGSPPAPRH